MPGRQPIPRAVPLHASPSLAPAGAFPLGKRFDLQAAAQRMLFADQRQISQEPNYFIRVITVYKALTNVLEFSGTNIDMMVGVRVSSQYT